MSRLLQPILCVTIVMVVLTARAQNQLHPPKFPGTRTKPTAATAPIQSPVSFFRQLLAMPPDERDNALTNRPPEIRARILAKVTEYEALDPDDRELRLRATELRWWLTPMLRMPQAERLTRLANVPDNLRELVKSRLAQWSILPPPLQDEFLANDQALHYFALVETNQPAAISERQQQIAGQFNQFFELTPEEKEQTLNLLSDAERAEMQKTLLSFEKLPPAQRLVCVQNYAKFAGMSSNERAEFLKNAESWSKMSPKERQAWRDLVQNVPIWPPMPPGMVSASQTPDTTSGPPRPDASTNAN